jgi:hypothetical protein
MRLVDYEQIQCIESRIDYFFNEKIHEEWINSSKACEILGISKSSLNYHTIKGNIGFSIFGSQKYYFKHEIESFKKFRNSI